MNKTKKLPWFKVYTTSLGVLKNIDPAKVGAGLILALEYMNNPENEAAIKEKITDEITLIAFTTLQQGIDDSLQEYAERVEDGKRGAAAKKEKLRQSIIEEMKSQQQ